MERYEGATMIKTFRGMLADDGQDTIVLHTNDGSTGYRIVKFQLMGEKPAGANQESIVKIYKIKQTTFTANVDFSDNTLLGVAYLEAAADAKTESQAQIVIFDNEIFNQDIYISHVDDESGESVNYYIELEQTSLDLNESTVATLKDIRNVTAPT